MIVSVYPKYVNNPKEIFIIYLLHSFSFQTLNEMGIDNQGLVIRGKQNDNQYFPIY